MDIPITVLEKLRTYVLVLFNTYYITNLHTHNQFTIFTVVCKSSLPDRSFTLRS